MSFSGLGNPKLTHSGDRIAPERYNVYRSPLHLPRYTTLEVRFSDIGDLNDIRKTNVTLALLDQFYVRLMTKSFINKFTDSKTRGSVIQVYFDSVKLTSNVHLMHVTLSLDAMQASGISFNVRGIRLAGQNDIEGFRFNDIEILNC